MPITRPAIGAIAVEPVSAKPIKVLTLQFDSLRDHPDIGETIRRIEQQVHNMFSRHLIAHQRRNKAGIGIEFKLRDGEPEKALDYRSVRRGWSAADAGKLTYYWPLYQRILTPDTLQIIENWVAEGSIGDVEIMRPDREYHLERLATDPDIQDDWVQVAVGNFHRSTSQYRGLTQHVDTSVRKYHGPRIRAKRDTQGEERVPNVLFEQVAGGRFRPRSLSLVLVNPVFPFSSYDRVGRQNHRRLLKYAKELAPDHTTLPLPHDMWHDRELNDAERERVAEALRK